MSSINLVAVNLNQLETKLKHLKLVRVLAIVSLVMVVLLALFVFLLNVVTLPFSQIEKDTQNTLANLNSLHGKLVKYSFINDRINNIQSVTAKRKDFVSPLNLILQQLPQALSIDSFNVESNAMALMVSGNSLSDINQAIDLLVGLGNKGNIINKVSIKSLILDPTSGRYSLSLQASIR